MSVRKSFLFFAFAVSTAFAGDSLPIIGWGSCPNENSSTERYLEAKEAGFSHLIVWCNSVSSGRRLLSEAEKAGVKLIIGFSTRRITKMMDEAEAFTAAVKDSPALAYYFIIDEPHIRQAESIRDCVKRYNALDPMHPCYVNLFGSICDLRNRNDYELRCKLTGCATYSEYISRFFDVVPLKMISFDVYPVLSFKPIKDEDLRLHGKRVFIGERWYETLEIASAFARERKIPMFAFALTYAHRHYPMHNYPVPTKAHFS